MASQQSQELARRAGVIYEQRLRAQLEHTHPDEFVAIEPDSGDYFLGRTLSDAIQAARSAPPGASTIHPARRTQGDCRTGGDTLMNGEVDVSGRALIVLSIRPSHGTDAVSLPAWVDTAFTGELVIPQATITRLGLPQSAAVMAGLADGTQVVLDTFSCVIDWFGQERVVEVVENDGNLPLLGVGLLWERKLEIDYPARTLSLA